MFVKVLSFLQTGMRNLGFWDTAPCMLSTQMFTWDQVKLNKSLLRYVSDLHGSHCILLGLSANLPQVHSKVEWLQVLCLLLP